MKPVLAKLNQAPLASALLLACASAVAGGQTYQWVDQSGNVVYGDSPPQVDTRQVGAPDSGAAARVPVQPAVATAQGSSVDATGSRNDAALAEALAKLNSVMSEVQALNQQVDELERERAALASAGAAAQQRQGAATAAPQMVLGGPTIMEVAVVEPQPIESRMSEKDRARSRWALENAGQKRFLERLSRMGAERP